MSNDNNTNNSGINAVIFVSIAGKEWGARHWQTKSGNIDKIIGLATKHNKYDSVDQITVFYAKDANPKTISAIWLGNKKFAFRGKTPAEKFNGKKCNQLPKDYVAYRYSTYGYESGKSDRWHQSLD